VGAGPAGRVLGAAPVGGDEAISCWSSEQAAIEGRCPAAARLGLVNRLRIWLIRNCRLPLQPSRRIELFDEVRRRLAAAAWRRGCCPSFEEVVHLVQVLV